MKKSCFSILSALALAIIYFSACNKPNDADQKSALSLNFYPLVGNQSLVYNQEYTVNGRKLKFTKVQFYVSMVSLKNDVNTAIVPTMPYALVHAAEAAYSAGDIESGHYSVLEFAIGVDSISNHADPAQWGTTHPLYINSLYSSYWDWTHGYVFMKLEGYVDTTTAANGTALTGFAYHIGNDDMLRMISLSINNHITASEAVIELNVDYAKLLENIDFQAELQTHSTGTEAIAEKIADKAQEAITVK